ncbi:MAG: CoA transferase [Parasporobacterium sp.]|nr:CoA transferase [Parasporobacterium sp.]
MGQGIFEGLRVIDYTQAMAGPQCSLILADMGAEVIKIENHKDPARTRTGPPNVNGESLYFQTMNRNKKSVGIDMKSEEGKKVFSELVKSADVLIENYRPGVMAKLGFGYEDCKKLNDKIIYASASGFGQSGPYKNYPGLDLVAEAMGGPMSVTGFPEQPPTRPGIPFVDVLCGLNLCIGVLASLYNREKTGRGQQIDVALLDCAVAASATTLPKAVFGDAKPVRTGNRLDVPGGPADSFRAADRDIVISCSITNSHFTKLCDLMNMPELKDDPRFNTPFARLDSARAGDPLKEIINEWIKDKNGMWVVNSLLKMGVPAAPIFTYEEVYKDAHIRDVREMFPTVPHPTAGDLMITGNPIKMSEYPVAYRNACPPLGSNNTEIFKSIGFSEDEIRHFTEIGAIGGAE